MPDFWAFPPYTWPRFIRGLFLSRSVGLCQLAMIAGRLFGSVLRWGHGLAHDDLHRLMEFRLQPRKLCGLACHAALLKIKPPIDLNLQHMNPGPRVSVKTGHMAAGIRGVPGHLQPLLRQGPLPFRDLYTGAGRPVAIPQHNIR